MGVVGSKDKVEELHILRAKVSSLSLSLLSHKETISKLRVILDATQGPRIDLECMLGCMDHSPIGLVDCVGKLEEVFKGSSWELRYKDDLYGMYET